MLNIPVILGSVRQGRQSIFAANLLVKKLQEAGMQTRLVDFKEFPLPFYDQEKLPIQLYPNYPYPNVQAWSKIAEAADGFVIVAPEYNHGYSGVLKNALDWLFPEFKQKPVGLVGVSSGTIAGSRAIEQLRPIMENFTMFALRETVMFGKVQELFDDQGNLKDSKPLEANIDGMIKALAFMVEAIKKAKENSAGV
jgi:NAD(P)H-dependent FMN reductase